MSDTHAHSAGFVREGMLDQQEPPMREKGAVKWLRENLFSSPLNGILTILSIIVVYWLLSGLIPWLVNSVWTAGSLKECREVLSTSGLGSHDGACFGVIVDRWKQLIFGFYPSDLYWRPILAFLLFFVALAPILFAEKVPGQMIYFTLIYPFLAVWLIWGGAFWMPILIALGFVIGYLALVFGGKLNAIVGVVGAILAALFWWFLVMPLVNAGINAAVASSRMADAPAALTAEIEGLAPEIAALEAQMDETSATIAELVTVKDAALAKVLELRESGIDASAERQEYLASMDSLMAVRGELAQMNLELPLLNDRQRQARDLLGKVNELPANVAQITELLSQEATPENMARIATLSNSVTETQSTLGMIGLRPVNSREIGGFMLGIIIGVAAIVLSLPMGILLALGRQSPLFIINKICVVFIEVIRGVPLIVWLITASLLLNYFLPPGTNFDLMLRVIIMVTFFSAAYIAEVVRGGLAALPKGQYEAGDALGLDYWKSMRLIVLPQALKISIPGIVNTFIGLFKDTTLVVFIGLLDPIGLSNAIRATTDWNGIYWELFVFIGLLFFVMCYSMGRYSLWLENKLQREHR